MWRLTRRWEGQTIDPVHVPWTYTEGVHQVAAQATPQTPTGSPLSSWIGVASVVRVVVVVGGVGPVSHERAVGGMC